MAYTWSYFVPRSRVIHQEEELLKKKKTQKQLAFG